MTRRTLLALGAGLVAVLVTAGVLTRGGPDPAASVPPVGAAVTPRPGSVPDSTDPGRAGDVTWSPGPWGEVTVAGHRLLVPASAEHGPLRDRGDGWASDYTPTATGAAIAVLRGPWFVFAAPPALRPAVLATVLTPEAAGEPGPVNPAPGWAVPTDLVAGFATQDARLLGAVARLTDPHRAQVEVYQHLATATAPVVVRSTHHLTYTDRQWLIEASYADSPGAQVPVGEVPTEFTVPGPELSP